MLREEVKKHPNWEIVGIYCDEDFSGAGTYRPDFERMIKSCKNGEVDIVLCKSQSRFSRDVEVIEKYIHNKFIEWNVRFISLIDNADTSNKGNKKARQINALVNEWFLEELSDNIKATLHAKWNNGECTSSFAKYGFIKDPKNKNHLIIDEVASEVLKDIANMFLSGYGQKKIASVLEEKKIPSPYEYKIMNGSKLKIPNKTFNSKEISKSGTYVIRISLYNKYKQILKNIKSIFTLGTDKEKEYNTKFNIKVKSINDDLKLYYTTKKLSNIDKIDLNNVKFNDSNIWNELKNDDILPTNAFYIACFNKELDRLIETDFELELNLKENRSHNIYKLYTKAISSNNISFEFDYEIRKKYKWNGRVIYNMLKDEIYNGTLIQGKSRRISYKNHKCIKTEKTNWVTSENAIEKIFDDETWFAIKQKLNEKNKSGLDGTKHILCGKVYCAVCGSILHKNSSSRNKDSKKIEYLLCKDKQSKWSNCDNNKSIKLNELKEIILNEINKFLTKYYDKNILKNIYKDNIDTLLFKEEIYNLKKEESETKNIINKKQDIFVQLYEDYITGIIDNNEFSELKLKYKNSLNKLKDRLIMINDELNLIENKKNELLNGNYIISKYQKIQELTPELINQFILKIEIGKLDEKTFTREISITWNF